MSEDPKVYRTLGPIYISSIQPLLNKENLSALYKIRTIISITKSKIPDIYTKSDSPYITLQIPIDDLPTEVIIPYISKVNELINQTIYKPSTKHKEKPKLTNDAILIHCQSGTSRSVAFVCAYFMNKFNLSLDHALHAIRRNNPDRLFQPNEGFLEQLQIYKDSNYITDLSELRKKSARWRAYRMHYLIKPGNIDYLSLGEEGLKNENWFGVKCDKCRSLLASSEVYVPHEPPFDKDDKQLYFVKNAYKSKRVIDAQIGQSECSHIFIEPLNWMKNKLIDGDLEGRLDCYKCGNKVGAWNWKGERCSCGKWMIPAIHLLKNRVVQVDKDNKLILKSDLRAI